MDDLAAEGHSERQSGDPGCRREEDKEKREKQRRRENERKRGR